ncbi:MAG: metal-sensitive transcriptional regulator [Patescibacteria group bacterium]|nr:metal-sensitive transcriptional regulator [Patescibacteria group bacterium]
MAYRPKDTQERILHRLKIVRGHLNKVISMVEKDEYCIDILTQSQAVRKAIEEIDALLLENHMNSCVINHIKKGNATESINEIMKVFKNNRK